jgi:hypothetical protein
MAIFKYVRSIRCTDTETDIQQGCDRKKDQTIDMADAEKSSTGQIEATRTGPWIQRPSN